MIEDDIDRLIAEMQNKPYDSSRYLDNGSNNPVAGSSPQSTYPGNPSVVPVSNVYQNSFQSVNSIQIDSRMNRFQQ